MKTIGIIGAMPSETADIRLDLGEAEKETIAKYDFYINELDGKRIVNVCCGVAKVNSAVATQILIDRFNADYIINTGVAGAMHKDVKVCDIVIATDVMHHDVTPRFLENYPPHCSQYKADEHLTSLAVKSCEKFGYTSHRGRIVSGEQFISDSKQKEAIVNDFNPYAVDMESASIGHCCYRNDIPFATIRCMSDSADDEGEMSFDEFEKVAAKRVADVVLDVVKKL